MTVDWAPFTQPDPLVDAGQASCREPPFKCDLYDIPSHTLIANTDYSPTNEAFSYPDPFDKVHLADSYTARPDYSLDEFLNFDSFFDRPANTVELPAGFAPKNHAVFNSTLPAAASAVASSNMNVWGQSSVNPPPFGRLGSYNEPFTHGLPFGSISTDAFESSCPSPRNSSPTPSLCGDGAQLRQVPSPAASTSSLKRESPDEPTIAGEEPAPKRVQRKRGRPKLNRSETDTSNYSNGDSPRSRPSRRLPHNQVERKYREGLNSELERLRRAVPTLPQRDSSDLTGPPKPSKATVLASAIDYIKKIERERDMLLEENERLRGMRPNAAKMRGYGWQKTRSNSASSLSMNS
ncbi:hypothetical protein BCR34DRAFT_592595 [Clohesyomyces aquaticus]|uniref:BHLH domain-containing protein n=1 Tax=Clohesyomyces aquaticus TaxID=1231657 RepID=A0A1Y1YQS3_9PLEO|nr:hypothetical protein BCR34DRAFT_592595 [Clohesyomyces aquaticus]